MFDRFSAHISSVLDNSGSQIYLLAFSGGKDSVCLAHLLELAKVPFEIAHVNFGLRAEESDGDESFARKWAESRGIPFHLNLGRTKELAEAKGISIQMAAREIRYSFFEKVRRERQLAGILLAHHEDDQIETILLNLLRGTGIEGIYGMAERKGWLIRPMLPFSRLDIDQFIFENQLDWREDSSNKKLDYKRNRMRHQGIPALLCLEPDARKNLLSSFFRLKDTGKAFSGLFESWKKEHIKVENDFQFLPFSDIQNQSGGASLIYFWLRSFGFNSDQAQLIFDSTYHVHSGKQFKSHTHLLSLDREGLFLSEIKDPFSPIFFDRGEDSFEIPEGTFQVTEESGTILLDKNPENAQLDADLLEFPLEIRTWQEGDRFNPLGMSTHKNVSDFLIDSKIPLVRKQQVKVVVSGGQIAWILGMRIANWAKRTSMTRKVFYIKKR